MTNTDIPDVGDTDLTREDMEKVAAECDIDPGDLSDQQLLERLGVALGEIGESEVDEDSADQTLPGEQIEGPTRNEIRDELRELGLPVTGTKDELQERLAEARGEQDGEEGDQAGSEEDEAADDERLRDRAADGLKAAGDWLQESGRDAGGGSGPSRLELATRAVKRRLPFVGRG